jgi:serine/threonine-protein kinase
MELVNGPSLAAVLADGPLDPGQTMDVVAQVAAGLQAAHAAGLVHRDIKPANLLLGPGGQVKITDFGIAHVAGSAPVTRTGAVIGTPNYLAPERVAGASATPAADLYSLGVVAYECLTGAPPFSGSPVEVAVAHRDRQLPAFPHTVPAEVAHLVADLTAKDPAARPASADEVAGRAGQLRDHPAGEVTTDTSWLPVFPDTLAGMNALGPVPGGRPRRASRARPQPWRRRSRLSWRMVTAMAALALVGALALVAALSNGSQSQVPPAAAAGTRSPSAPGTVLVSADSLIGQPVDQVRQRLHQLGLTVDVRWHPSEQQTGTVLAVQPSGQVSTASTIVLIAAFTPGQHGDGQGNGNGGDNGGGGGDGDGGGNGGG